MERDNLFLTDGFRGSCDLSAGAVAAIASLIITHI